MSEVNIDTAEAARELRAIEKRAAFGGFVAATAALIFALVYDEDWRLAHLVWDAIGWVIIFGFVGYVLRGSSIESKRASLRRREEIDVILRASKTPHL